MEPNLIEEQKPKVLSPIKTLILIGFILIFVPVLLWNISIFYRYVSDRILVNKVELAGKYLVEYWNTNNHKYPSREDFVKKFSHERITYRVSANFKESSLFYKPYKLRDFTPGNPDITREFFGDKFNGIYLDICKSGESCSSYVVFDRYGDTNGNKDKDFNSNYTYAFVYENHITNPPGEIFDLVDSEDVYAIPPNFKIAFPYSAFDRDYKKFHKISNLKFDSNYFETSKEPTDYPYGGVYASTGAMSEVLKAKDVNGLTSIIYDYSQCGVISKNNDTHLADIGSCKLIGTYKINIEISK